MLKNQNRGKNLLFLNLAIILWTIKQTTAKSFSMKSFSTSQEVESEFQDKNLVTVRYKESFLKRLEGRSIEEIENL